MAGVERFERPNDGVRVNPIPHLTAKIADNTYDFLPFRAYSPPFPVANPIFTFLFCYLFANFGLACLFAVFE